MTNPTIPRTPFALISGSGSWGVDFPAGVGEAGISVVERGLAFDTPHGRIENFSVFRIDGSETVDGRERLVLNVFAHGWRPGLLDHGAFQQVFWVLLIVNKELSESSLFGASTLQDVIQVII